MRRVACLALLASCYRAPEQCDINASFECQNANVGPDAFDFWPFVVELFPPDNAKGVPLGITPTVKFTEQVTGVSSSSFVLSPPTNAVVEYEAATRIASLHPEGELAPSTQYTVTLTAEIRDFTGNTLYGKRSWTFKTLHDTTSPSVKTVEPANGAPNVPIDTILVATFSEQVSHITGATFTLEDGQGLVPCSIGYVSQTAVKLTPSATLAPHTTYTATLAAGITDLIGNPLVDAPVKWSFTTGDTIAPAMFTTTAPTP